MSRRKWYLPVVVLAPAMVLAACSGSSGGVPLGGAGGGEEGADAGGSITVITSTAPWNPAYDAVVAAYEEETGVKVDLRSFPNDEVKTQMLNDAQGGTHTFDVYQVNEVDLAYFNANELLLPFTEADPDFELDDEIIRYDNLPFWDASLQTFAETGVVTAVPLLGNIQILVHRTDIYEELGLEVPTTWDETLANARAVVEEGAARYGYVMRTQGVPGTPGATFDFAGLLYGSGGSFFREPGVDWTPALDTPEALKAATLLRELALTGPADPKAVGQAEAIAIMQAGDAAQLDVVAAAASSMNDASSSNVVGKVGYSPLPGGMSATGLWVLGIPADLPEDRRGPALHFINWVTSERGMEIFAENGGIPTRTDAYDAEGISADAQPYLDAVQEGAKTAVGPFRLVFIGEFLTATEPVIAAIAAGDVTPEEGLAQLQAELTAIVEDAGVPMG